MTEECTCCAADRAAEVAGGRRLRFGKNWQRFLSVLGGYPYEVARPEAVFDFCRARGLELVKLRTVKGHSNNEFTFRKISGAPAGREQAR